MDCVIIVPTFEPVCITSNSKRVRSLSQNNVGELNLQTPVTCCAGFIPLHKSLIKSTLSSSNNPSSSASSPLPLLPNKRSVTSNARSIPTLVKMLSSSSSPPSCITITCIGRPSRGNPSELRIDDDDDEDASCALVAGMVVVGVDVVGSGVVGLDDGVTVVADVGDILGEIVVVLLSSCCCCGVVSDTLRTVGANDTLEEKVVVG